MDQLSLSPQRSSPSQNPSRSRSHSHNHAHSLIRPSPVVPSPSRPTSPSVLQTGDSDSPKREKVDDGDLIFERDFEFAGPISHLNQAEAIDISVPSVLDECAISLAAENGSSALETEGSSGWEGFPTSPVQKIIFPVSNTAGTTTDKAGDKGGDSKVKETPRFIDLPAQPSARRDSFVSYSDLINDERLSSVIGRAREEATGSLA